MSGDISLIDALDDLNEARHMTNLLRLAVVALHGEADKSDTAAIAAGIEVVAGNIDAATGRLREINDQIRAARQGTACAS